MSERKIKDWVRGPKRADLSEVGLQKIQEAHKERGINVELDADNPEKSVVTKTVVKGGVSESSE